MIRLIRLTIFEENSLHVLNSFVQLNSRGRDGGGGFVLSYTFRVDWAAGCASRACRLCKVVSS